MPSHKPTPRPTLQPSLKPTPEPSLKPSPEPSFSHRPTSYESAQPTTKPATASVGQGGVAADTGLGNNAESVSAASFSGQGFEVVFDDEAAGVISGFVGTGVLLSIVGSVGAALITAPAAGMAAASASSSSSSSVGDPLALIFSVQSIAVMSKLGSLPASYTSFAEVLNIFILKLAPPRAVRQWLRPKEEDSEEKGAARRLSSQGLFDDDSDATDRFCFCVQTLCGRITERTSALVPLLLQSLPLTNPLRCSC